MRHPFLASLSIAAALSVAMAQAAPRTVSIELSVKDKTIKAGAKIWIDVVLTNLSNHPIEPGFFDSLPSEEADASRVELLDSRGKPVALKGLDQSACRGIANCRVVWRHGVRSYVRTTLDPGKSMKSGFMIIDSYDLSQPGTYTIQAFRRDKDTGVIEKSNLLSFTIVP